jgi:outer membrane receptor for ferrienterochelin and colicins
VDNFGILAQTEWDPDSKWNVVAGARLDFNSQLDDPVLSPRVSVKHQWTDDLALRGSYSSGFRAPQVFDEDLHITQAGGVAQVIRNASGLEEESSQSVALGFEWNPWLDPEVFPEGLLLASDKPITLEINAFLTRLEDTFDIVETDNPATPEQEFTRVNSFGADVYGAEFNLVWDLAKDLRLDLGYVEQRSLFDEPAGDFGSRSFDRTPERYGVIGLTWNAPWCGVFLGGKYTGPMEVNHYAGDIPEDRLETSPSFFTVDLALTREFIVKDSEVTLTAGVKNLFDDYQDDLDSGPNRDSGYVYGPRYPRMFHLGCKIAF